MITSEESVELNGNSDKEQTIIPNGNFDKQQTIQNGNHLHHQDLISAESYQLLMKDFHKIVQSHEKLKKDACACRESVDTKTKQITELEKEVAELRSQLSTSTTQQSRFEKALKCFFTGAQKHFVVGHIENGEWNDETLKRTLAIRYLSEKCYAYLHENLVYALPDLSALQKWVTQVNFQEGILHEFLSVMDVIAKELTDKEKIAVLQIGEMKVKSLYEYNKGTDEVVGPHSFVQIVVVTGFYANWKQPIYLSFDKRISRNILNELIEKLHDMSYPVISCISDFNEGMSQFWKEMKINSTTSYFRHPVTHDKIYYFVESSMLLKEICSTLLDTGFTLSNGNKVTKEPLEHLIDINHKESKYFSRINKKHLECAGEEQYDLKLASQLFCYDVAVDLKRFFPGPDKALAYSTGVFIEYISKWFAVTRHYFTSNLHKQNLALNTASDIVSKIIVDNNSYLKILQEAILISISSLLLLPVDLWGTYNINTISTEKLSNQELYCLFSQIGGKKYQTNLISPLNVIDQLKKIIFGNNQTKIDGEYVTQKILSSIVPQDSENKDENEATPSDDSQNTISSVSLINDQDDINYLISSIAYKFVDTYPEIGTRTSDVKLQSPYKHVEMNMDTFVEPSKVLLEVAKKLNSIFQKVHGHKLFTAQPGISQVLIDLVTKLYPDINLAVARYFFKERLMLRMKYLNANIHRAEDCFDKGRDIEFGIKI